MSTKPNGWGLNWHASSADVDRAENLLIEAASLRERFERAFWCEELDSYALALDGSGSPCRVRSSNAGHCLLAGIAGPERGLKTARSLLTEAVLQRLGHSDDRDIGGAIQPHVLSQRLGLAARQCVGRSRHGPLWLQRRRGEDSDRDSSTPASSSTSIGCPNCFADSPDAPAKVRRSIRPPAPPSLGFRRRLSAAAIVFRTADRCAPRPPQFRRSGASSISRTSRDPRAHDRECARRSDTRPPSGGRRSHGHPPHR